MVTARLRNKFFGVGACLSPRIPVPLARHLWDTTREDFIPEFPEDHPAFERCSDA